MLLSRPAHRWDAKSSTGQDQDPHYTQQRTRLVYCRVRSVYASVRGACRLRVSGVSIC